MAKNQAEFDKRVESYLNGGPEKHTIDDVLVPLNAWHTSKLRFFANVAYSMEAEDALMAATGEVFRLVGMKLKDNGNGVDVPTAKGAKPGIAEGM
jgi:hypothetical protein